MLNDFFSYVVNDLAKADIVEWSAFALSVLAVFFALWVAIKNHKYIKQQEKNLPGV